MTETYMRKRYRTDSDFREKQLKYGKKYSHEHLEQIAKAAKIRYANRTIQQIAARKKYLKRHRSKQ